MPEPTTINGDKKIPEGSSLLHSEDEPSTRASTHAPNLRNGWLLTISADIDDSLNVNDLGNIYAEIRTEHDIELGIEEFTQNQKIMLIPAPPPKIKLNWMAVGLAIVTLLIGMAIGYGIIYFINEYTSFRLPGSRLGVKKIKNDIENFPILPHINLTLPDVDKIRKEVERGQKMREETEKMLKKPFFS